MSARPDPLRWPADHPWAPLPARTRVVDGGVAAVAGVRAAGVAAQVKVAGALDVGLLTVTPGTGSAVALTRNAAPAAPVRLVRAMPAGGLTAVAVNAGNANAATGAAGDEHARRMRTAAAAALGRPEAAVAVASTGIIGVPLPVERVEAGIARAARTLAAGSAAGARFADAIRTTDAFPKTFALELADGRRVGGTAKGAGMIGPELAPSATLLVFLAVDAPLDAAACRRVLDAALAGSFAVITVDGQASTNDMVLLLASGARADADGRAGAEAELAAAIAAVARRLALAVVADGEGASHIVRATVTGAADPAEADAVVRAIADSPLVKTAAGGRDPNPGRVVQAAGMALGRLGVADASVEGDLTWHDGALVTAACRLDRGPATAERFASDLTEAYVHLNSEYAT